MTTDFKFVLPERVRATKDAINSCSDCGSNTKKPRRSQRIKKIHLRTLNSFITCGLCHGYLIDAASITECLHSFCKSCILQYFEIHNRCPTCNLFLHHSYPKNYLNPDRTLQDLVYKLVPGLKDNEKAREKEFYKSRGIEPDPPSVSPVPSPPTSAPEVTDPEEEVEVCLKSLGRHVGKIRRKFVKVTGHATIGHLRKYLAIKLYDDHSRMEQLELLCNGDVVTPDQTLKNILMTKCPIRDEPMMLHFRIARRRRRRRHSLVKKTTRRLVKRIERDDFLTS